MGEVVRIVEPYHQHWEAGEHRKGRVDPILPFSNRQVLIASGTYQNSAYTKSDPTCPVGHA